MICLCMIRGSGPLPPWWTLGFEQKMSGLHGNYLYLLSHFPGLIFWDWGFSLNLGLTDLA